MATEVKLPFELISHVIFLSSDDNTRLLSLCLVSQWFHHEAARHLYAISPPVKLGISMSGSSPMQFIQVIKRSIYHATLVRHFTLSIVAYDEKIIEIVQALERMVNLQTLEIRHIYIQAAHGLMDLTPTLFDNPKCKFRLRTLLWSSNRQEIALLRLGELIALHRDTLEILRVNFQSDARDMNHNTNIRIMTAVQFRTADASDPKVQPRAAVSATRSVWPLPRLRALLGSQETLDILFPLVARNHQIAKLEIITPAGSQFYHPSGSPDPKHTLPRLIECVKHSPIRVLHIDFVRNMTLKLQDLIPHLPLLQTLKLHQANLLTINEALEPLKNLRVLLMTFKDATDIGRFPIPSTFTACPSLEQIEVGIAQDSEGAYLYTRWWVHNLGGGKSTKQDSDGDANDATIRHVGNFEGPSHYFLQMFS